ncbi:MAG: GspMb/PilO family protein [Prosthecobacter sp.]|uniref:GspMb/PilO family protein n=1 Tax=Prosthecobacter sp. TaxID=1965333 RepID=UPI003BB0622C
MKASELRLLMILGVLAALCGGALLSQRLLRKQHAIERREQALELRQMEMQSMLTEVEMWRQRLNWLQTTQPAMTSENQASEQLLETLLATAAANGLTVQKKQLHEPVTAAFYREVGVTLTIRGPLPSVFRWMHGLLAPASFRVIPQVKITPDAANPADVVAILHISQLLAPAVAQEPTPEGAGS